MYSRFLSITIVKDLIGLVPSGIITILHCSSFSSVVLSISSISSSLSQHTTCCDSSWSSFHWLLLKSPYGDAWCPFEITESFEGSLITQRRRSLTIHAITIFRSRLRRRRTWTRDSDFQELVKNVDWDIWMLLVSPLTMSSVETILSLEVENASTSSSAFWSYLLNPSLPWTRDHRFAPCKRIRNPANFCCWKAESRD